MSRVSGVWVKTLISNRVRRESSVRIFESVEACTVHSTGVHWLYSCTVAVMYRALQTEAQSPQYRPRLATRLWHPTTAIRRQTEDRQSRSLRSYLDKQQRKGASASASKQWQHQPWLGPASDLFLWHTDLQSYPHENAGRVVTQSVLSVCSQISFSCQNILVKLMWWWQHYDMHHSPKGPDHNLWPGVILWFQKNAKLTKQIFVTLVTFEKVRAPSWNTLLQRF